MGIRQSLSYWIVGKAISAAGGLDNLSSSLIPDVAKHLPGSTNSLESKGSHKTRYGLTCCGKGCQGGGECEWCGRQDFRTLFSCAYYSPIVFADGH